MPQISAFYGIVVYMYWMDHRPPHFHAFYGEYQVAVAIENAEIIAGSVPSRAYRLIAEWTRLRKPQLLEDWRRCQIPEAPLPVEPLP